MVAELNRAQLASGMAEKLKQHEERARYGIECDVTWYEVLAFATLLSHLARPKKMAKV